MIKKNLILIIATLLYASTAEAFFPINYFRPWDVENVVKPYRSKGAWLDVACLSEFGLSTVGRTSCEVLCEPSKDGQEVNVLHVWQDEQDGLAMLKGFNPSSAIGALGQQLNIDDDNGIRGHFKFCGDLDIKSNVIFSSRFYLKHNFIAGIYIPFVSLSLTTTYQDLTQMVTEEDFLTKSLLTNNFAANVFELGNGLDINGWDRKGLGDIAALIEWSKNFPQAKPLLKNVNTHIRGGLTIPTGKAADPDQIMSIPLGNDGAFGLLFGAGLDLSLMRFINLGVDVEFLFLFSNERIRRVKTDQSQTELLLLEKTLALKDFGLTQRFNVYAELFKMFDRLTFRFTYQFWKHDDDRVTIACSNEFSSIPANTAVSLEEWTMHHFIYNLSYDCEQEVGEDARVRPYFSLFYKQRINGKNSFMANTMGFLASFTF